MKTKKRYKNCGSRFTVHGSRGFTLLEVMVSVAILAFMMTIVWSSTSQSMRVKKRVEGRGQITHQGMIVLRKITDDINVAFLAKRLPPAQPQGQIAPIPPSAAPSGPKTFFIGKDKGNQDEISFTSFSHLRMFKEAKESDQCRIAYEVARSEKDQEKYVILRREEAWLDDTTEVKADGLVIAEGVRDFEIEYYDERADEWKKEWDTEKVDWQGKLPKAVRIKISFPDPYDDTKSIELSTAVILALSKGPIEM